LFIKKKTILATAQKCLKVGSASFDILETTDIITPLGKICIVKVTKEGLAVIAGPNKSSHLRYIQNRMINDLKCDIILVDGALNRIVPMVETDGIILATGASRNTNINNLAHETMALYKLLNLPVVSEKQQEYFSGINKITLVLNSGNKISLKYSSLIDDFTIRDILEKINDIKIIFIPALISLSKLKKLNELICKMWEGKTLIIQDSLRLIAGGSPEIVLNEIERIRLNKGIVKTLRSVPLLAITVNPFYPKYRFDKGNYEPGFIERETLVNTIKHIVDIPVIDIKHEGSLKITETILKRLLL
jgi:hypothetical protein